MFDSQSQVSADFLEKEWNPEAQGSENYYPGFQKEYSDASLKGREPDLLLHEGATLHMVEQDNTHLEANTAFQSCGLVDTMQWFAGGQPGNALHSCKEACMVDGREG